MKMDDFEYREKLILSSIVNERCSIGISTNVEVQLIDIQERNKKKLFKLKESLEILIKKTSTEKYHKRAKSDKKEKDLSHVRSYH